MKDKHHNSASNEATPVADTMLTPSPLAQVKHISGSKSGNSLWHNVKRIEDPDIDRVAMRGYD